MGINQYFLIYGAKMADFEILHYSEKSTQSILKNLCASGSLIPIIGSGFSKGSSTKAGKKVPDGKNLKKLMKDALTKISPEKSKLINENTEFSKVAEKYLKLVPREE